LELFKLIERIVRAWQTLVSEALGMEVAVNGDMHLRLFPSLHVTMENVRIRNHGTEIASAAHIGVGIELLQSSASAMAGVMRKYAHSARERFH
jgi:uncharacterized protein involved in outer membrane biogenesis